MSFERKSHRIRDEKGGPEKTELLFYFYLLLPIFVNSESTGHVLGQTTPEQQFGASVVKLHLWRLRSSRDQVPVSLLPTRLIPLPPHHAGAYPARSWVAEILHPRG